MNSTLDISQKKLPLKHSAIAYYNQTIDDADDNDTSTYYYDKFNNYTFFVTRKRGSTFISPGLLDQSSLIEIKVGVLLPFHQSNDGWTKMMTMSGISAIRLAVAEINTKQLIPGAYITLVEKDSYPKPVEGQAAITQAVYSAISLIQEGVVGIIGDISSSWTSFSALMTSTLQIPQCSFSAVATSLSDKTQFGYFFRTVPTNLLYSDAAVSFIVSQGWPDLGVLYSDDDFGQQLSESLVMKARVSGIHVKSYQSFYEDGIKSDIKKSLDSLVSTGVRIIFVAAEGEAQLAAMTLAAHTGYINNETVWLTTAMDVDDLYKAVLSFNSIIEKRVNHTDIVPTVEETSEDLTITKKQNSSGPIEYAARMATNLTTINYNKTFSGGVFSFETLNELPGYEPFDVFLGKWSQLDPIIYPYGGQTNVSSNEGMAYSCMMVMADGFNRTVSNSTGPSTNITHMLEQLAAGQLGDYLSPSTFNTSFLGPVGPVILDQNGDMATGSFRVYNIQNGVQRDIGRMIAGNLNLTSPPIFHDGTTKAPTGVPDRSYLNPGYKSPVSIALLSMSAFGTVIVLFSMIIVIFYRKREVFKASSPLFCVLELVGFLLTYVSVAFFLGYRSSFNCTMIPITFHLGYSLILGNLIAKNYRIYRIFNNIFITRTVVTDAQLLKVSGAIVTITVIILTAWFSSTTVSTVNKPVSRNAYYVDCAYDGSNVTIFVALLTLSESLQLCFATFLAFKTRSVGRSYSKYSEYKQIAVSVYNIFFSIIIGFIVFFVPTTDFYTRHYLTATMIVWATTFSLLALFIPKLHAFFSPKMNNGRNHDKATDLSRKKRSVCGMDNLQSSQDNHGDATYLPPEFHGIQRSDSEYSGLKSLNYMISNMSHYGDSTPSKVKLNSLNKKGHMEGVLMEVHEVEVPVQYAFRYFSFLAAWEMAQVILMPDISYLSFYSKKSGNGRAFKYHGATIVSSKEGSYVLKVHGLGLWDLLIQVEQEKELLEWHDWFNNISNPRDDFLLTDEATCLGSPSSSSAGKRFTENAYKKGSDFPEGFQGSRNGSVSSNSTSHDSEDRRGSEMTIACTIDSNYYYEPDSSMVEHYGINEIKHAKQIQEQRRLHSNRDFSNEQENKVVESSTDAQADSRLHFANSS
ncbi:periplasmic binding protein-like I [Rhizopus microsporus]